MAVGEETKSEESLDDFYFWGELLISDFDDVDKNLVDADKLFTNLQDLKNIMDDFDFLDEEQESAIRQFFQNFSIEKHTELKEKFISLWDKLGDIYRNYRSRLTTLGIAYNGECEFLPHIESCPYGLLNQAAVTLHDLLFQRVKRSETDSCNDQCFGPEFQMRLGSDEQFFASDVQTEQEKSGSL